MSANENCPERRRFDLEERTAKFGEAVIGFARKVSIDPVTAPLVSQVVRSATSVGANYCEADDACSKKDFRYRINICKREARETKHWLRMIAAAAEQHKDPARVLWQEAKELHLIFAAISRGKAEENSRLRHSSFSIRHSFVIRA